MDSVFEFYLGLLFPSFYQLGCRRCIIFVFAFAFFFFLHVLFLRVRVVSVRDPSLLGCTTSSIFFVFVFFLMFLLFINLLRMIRIILRIIQRWWTRSTGCYQLQLRHVLSPIQRRLFIRNLFSIGIIDMGLCLCLCLWLMLMMAPPLLLLVHPFAALGEHFPTPFPLKVL